MFIRGPNGEMMMMLLHIREPLAIAILGFQKKKPRRRQEKKQNIVWKGFKTPKFLSFLGLVVVIENLFGAWLDDDKNGINSICLFSLYFPVAD